jgi:electron transfer flavoprotein alpha subunit
MPKLLIVSEMLDGKVRKSTHSSITFARSANLPFTLLVIGAGATTAASEMRAFGAEKILVCDDASLSAHICERYVPTIVAVAKGGFDVVAVTASSFGKDIAPRCAAKLQAGYAPDISSVTNEGGTLTYRRPVYAGNAFAVCKLLTKVQVVSVRQSEFMAAEATGGESPVETVAMVAADAAAAQIEFLSLDAQKSERPDLGEARVIVSGGRALKEQFATVLDPLAALLGAAVGASRAACDAGYAPPELQVGQTGRVVAPKLYLAVGISGAIQHLAGMKGSKTIVAINKDPDAPIFQVADYGLVADLFTAVPELVTELKSAT